METFSALLAICAGNSPVPDEFPSQRPVARSFDVFFDLRLNKRLSKQSWGWWFETLPCPLWRHCNACLAELGRHWFKNGLSPDRRQAVISTNGTNGNFSEITAREQTSLETNGNVRNQFSSTTLYFKSSSIILPPFRFDLNVSSQQAHTCTEIDVLKTRFQDVQDVNSEDVHKT